MKKILVVDDEPDLREMLKVRLESAEYEIVLAQNGEEALEVARKEQPNLIILDIVMPKMNGYEFIQTLNAEEEIAQIPVIVLTAKDKMEEIFKIEGVKDYLLKPFESEELINKVNEVLG